MNFFKRNKNTQPVEQQEKQDEVKIFSPYADSLLFGKFHVDSGLFLSAVYAAMELISNSIALMPIYVKQIKENKRTIVENHNVSRLFYNMLMSKFNIMKQIVWDVLLKGNSYIFVHRDESGSPVNLQYLEPNDVTINYDKLNGVVTYQVSNHKGVPSVVTQHDMLHFTRNCSDAIQGRGFLWFARDTIKLAGFTEKSAEQFFKSGCNLNGILSFQGRLTNDQKESIRKAWNQVHGVGGSGLVITEGDSSYSSISSSASDSQMIETRGYNLTEIARFFNISPILLGDLSHSSYSDIEQANIEFVGHTLLPIINMMTEEIDRKLLDNSTVLYSSFDEQVLLKADKNSMANYLQTLVNAGIMTINEARYVLDLNPVDGGDELVIPYTDINTNKINGTNITEDNNDEQQGNSLTE